MLCRVMLKNSYKVIGVLREGEGEGEEDTVFFLVHFQSFDFSTQFRD